MALSTRPYSDLEFLVMARAGGTITDNAKQRVQALANSAAHIACNASPYWPRLLVLEERTIANGYVEYTEDSYVVSDAGTENANGLYVRNGESSGLPKYTLFENDGITERYSVFTQDGSGDSWQLEKTGLDPLYTNSQISLTPPTSGWVVDTGTSPAPTLKATSTIDEVHSIWDGEKWTGASPRQLDFYPDAEGIRVTNANTDATTVFVAYKKVVVDKYGDGTGGTVSDVPSEWFEYMAYHAAMSYQVAEQVGAERMTIAFRDVQGRLDDELLRISRQGIWRTIAQKMKTYYNFDVSVR